jgi:glyoxylate/hydroxypyruvate reductase A
MINVLFASKPSAWAEYEAPLRAGFEAKGLDVALSTETDAPETIDYIIYAPNSKIRDFTPFTRLKAVQNLWAGVENVVGNDTLKVPLCRMVDEGLTDGMVEWVLGHVMRHHLGMDAHIINPDKNWIETFPPLARERSVTVLGLGALGAACAQTLAGLKFDVHGWSRSLKQIDGVTCHAGTEGLKAALAKAEICILLLPLTPETENILDAEAFARMPKGAFIINPGRGRMIDDDALLAALGSGQIGHATLDVFRVEPLPQDHPFWSHSQVTVTPHIASVTRISTSAQVVVDNIARAEAGQALLHVVDRNAGY